MLEQVSTADQHQLRLLIDCFYNTVLGPKGSTQPLVNTSHADDGLSTSQLLAMWLLAMWAA